METPQFDPAGDSPFLAQGKELLLIPGLRAEAMVKMQPEGAVRTSR